MDAITFEAAIMVALNENLALENPALGSKNRGGIFFGQNGKSRPVNRHSGQWPRRENVHGYDKTAPGMLFYGYDSENNWVSVTTPAGVTRYLVDPHGDALPRVLVRTKPDSSTTTYVYGIGLLYELDDSTGDATYYHYDNIGNTAALTGPLGAVTDRIEYSPYGQITHRTGTTDTPFLYVGQLGVQQDATGLFYMRARYYSPKFMRFVNVDPAQQGWNWLYHTLDSAKEIIKSWCEEK